MNFVDKILDWRYIQIAATIALLFIFYQLFGNHGVIATVGYSIILLSDIVLIWTRETWWNRTKYIFISSFIIVMALIMQRTYSVRMQGLLWPLVWFFATMRGEYNQLSIILASFTIGVILILSYTFPFPFETFFALVGLFLGIRSRRIRQEAYHTSQMHLKELNEAHRELQEAHAELQEASVYSMRYAALEERTRLAREIHDGIGHQLTSLIVQLQALEIMLSSDPKRASELVSQLLQISRRAMAEVRLAVREWSEDEMGLGIIALKGLVSQTQSRSSIQFNFIQDSEVTEWTIETSIVLYRILQESLTNVLRHSNAASVTVRIKEINGSIILVVTDDGNYTGDTPLTPGFGLKGIMERCRLHGGTCKVVPEKPHGLRIEIFLPVEPEETL
ncbi:MAG: sensor histidine kinase [Ignavibacteriales bacterium]